MPRTLAVTLILAFAIVAPASAAKKNGITPLAPKAGTSVPAGKRPLFRMRSTGPGQVWVYVCKSKKKNAEGVICTKNNVFKGDSIGRAKKKNGVFQYKAKFFDFPEFWLNSPGTYYWQAHRISCTAGSSDCLQEGPIVKFKVA
jgi:hypothetical protein